MSSTGFAQRPARGGGGGGFSRPSGGMSRPSVPRAASPSARPSFSRPSSQPSRVFTPSRSNARNVNRGYVPAQPRPSVQRGSGIATERRGFFGGTRPRVQAPTRAVQSPGQRRFFPNRSGNYVDSGYANRNREANRWYDRHYKRNDNLRTFNASRRDWYHTHFHPRASFRYRACYRVYDFYRPHYFAWAGFGFYGGYWWGYASPYAIDSWFWNPMVYWIYADRLAWQETYYRNVYSTTEVLTYPDLAEPFARAGVFYPTEELKDLSLDASTLSALKQSLYRRSMNAFVITLETILRERFGSTLALSDQDVTVNHIQVLPARRGYVLEGFVAKDNGYDTSSVQFPFKALLDLSKADQTFVFTPKYGDAPAADDIAALNLLNDRIVQLGGVIEAGND